MRFMEIDEAGHILHIQDNPEITMLPVVNVIKYQDKTGKPLCDPLGRALSHHGHLMQSPMRISDEHFETLRTEGLTGQTGARKWVHKWDAEQGRPVKVDTF